MKRTKLDHAALAAAHDAQDWDTLMGAGLSWVRFALTKMQRTGAIHLQDIDEDLYQEGALALWRAVQKWDPLLYKFSSHVVLYIEGAMMNYLLQQAMQGVGSHSTAKRRGVPPPAISLNEIIRPTDGQDAVSDQETWQDKLEYRTSGETPIGLDLPENEVAREMTTRVVEQLMAELPSEDAALMRAVYQDETTFEDYGKVVGRTRSSLSRRVANIRERLQQKLSAPVIETGRNPDWKGVRQHYPAPPSFWASTAGPSTTVLADMPGRSYWSEKSGRVHGDWSWKPQPQDIMPKRKRASRKVAA